MRKDRILPALDAQAKQRRIKWAHTFFAFYKSVRAIDPAKCIVVLVHMDEKWFYAVVARTNCKVLTSIGLDPVDYFCHHKNHIQKEMYIVVTAFVLNGNDISRGGKAIPVACVRVGRMVKAKKDTYKRVYRENNTYHYPKIAENKLRTKGGLYFQEVELTGSNEGTKKKRCRF